MNRLQMLVRLMAVLLVGLPWQIHANAGEKATKPDPKDPPPPSTESKNLIRSMQADSCIWAAPLSPDGKLLAAGTDKCQVFVWDAKTGEKIRSFGLDGGGAVGLLFRPDGKELLTAPGGAVSDYTLRLWDVGTGKEVRRFTGHTSTVYGVAQSRDGKQMVSASADQTVRLWDVASGKELATLTGHTNVALRVAFSPDNQTVASGSDDASVRIWDTKTKKELHKLEHGGSVYGVAFSPDGMLLASIGYNRLALWDVTTGREIRQLNQTNGLCVAFSPDGTLLAASGNDNTVHVWEVATGQQVAGLTGHTAGVNCVSFSGDGKTVISGGYDQTVRLWDVGGASKEAKPRDLTNVELVSLWKDLAGENAATAFEAVCTLASGPKQSVPFLKEKLRPQVKAEVKKEQLQRWIKELDDDEFEVRDRASDSLKVHAEQAEVLLRQALEATQSLEVKRRIEEILGRLDARQLPPERLQALRGLSVLEKLATADAVELVEQLSKGTEDAWLTQRAKAALQRIKMRKE